MRFLRLLKIIAVAFRFGLEEFFPSHGWMRVLKIPIFFITIWRRKIKRPRAERLRMALEALGPIFIKFGQMLSTRRDLLPLDISDELAKLQDQVPPFASSVVLTTLEKIYGKSADEVFLEFDSEPIASASVAQVHFAVLHDGTKGCCKSLTSWD